MPKKTSKPRQPRLPILEQIPEGYALDPRGRLIPKVLIKKHELAEDALVRKIIGFAEELSGKIGRFKGRTFEDVAAFLDALSLRYGQKSKRGSDGKGNVTLSAYDGSMRVQITIADEMEFGPSLKVAKEIIDECIVKWSTGARVELKALVNEAFNVEKPGQVNRAALFSLLRMDIDDHDWKRAMVALRDSIRIIGSKLYIRLKRRADDGSWHNISLDIATAEIPEGKGLSESHIRKEGAA